MSLPHKEWFMRRLLSLLFCAGAALAQPPGPCSCGANPPGPPPERTLEPYANAPDDLRPYSRFTKPYFENYTKTVEYNGPARDLPVPDLKDLTEVRIAFLGPVSEHRDEDLGRMMLNGATMAIEEANAAGGYGGKPFKLMVHNDSAIWGASSNEIVKMSYDEQDWAMLGLISADTTHIALRVSLRSEMPIVNTAATDPTIPETIIPWLLTAIQDDRVQGYTLARRIYTERGFSRVALLRVNERYGRFGIVKFKDASRRLGHPVVLEQKFMPGDTDFHHQLSVIQDSNVDAIVLWADQIPAGNILKQMREMHETARFRRIPCVWRRNAAHRRTGRRRAGICFSVRSHARRSGMDRFQRALSEALREGARRVCIAGLRRHAHPAGLSMQGGPEPRAHP